jgi:hypothetical protein
MTEVKFYYCMLFGYTSGSTFFLSYYHRRLEKKSNTQIQNREKMFKQHSGLHYLKHSCEKCTRGGSKKKPPRNSITLTVMELNIHFFHSQKGSSFIIALICFCPESHMVNLWLQGWWWFYIKQASILFRFMWKCTQDTTHVSHISSPKCIPTQSSVSSINK